MLFLLLVLLHLHCQLSGICVLFPFHWHFQIKTSADPARARPSRARPQQSYAAAQVLARCVNKALGWTMQCSASWEGYWGPATPSILMQCPLPQSQFRWQVENLSLKEKAALTGDWLLGYWLLAVGKILLPHRSFLSSLTLSGQRCICNALAWHWVQSVQKELG